MKEEEKAKRDNLGSETKRYLTLVKRQMKENLTKDICRMKHSSRSSATFMAILLQQISNKSYSEIYSLSNIIFQVHSALLLRKVMVGCYCSLSPMTGSLCYELYLGLYRRFSNSGQLCPCHECQEFPGLQNVATTKLEVYTTSEWLALIICLSHLESSQSTGR